MKKKKKRYTMVVTYFLCSNENQVVRVHGVGRVHAPGGYNTGAKCCTLTQPRTFNGY